MVVEVKAREKANGSCKKEHTKANYTHVSEIQAVGHPHISLKSQEVKSRVCKDVKGSGARGEERSPPPTVILRAELKVA